MAKFESILETVGRTPVVRIRKLAPPHVKLYVKVEAFNPMGSVKDRLALGLIDAAERSGQLRPGQTVIEATSGNTGIGLAMVCAAKGYPLVIVMAENFSVERRKMMRFLGAKVVLTPAWKIGTGMLAKAVELAEANGWFLCQQFENEANAEGHSRTTAREILADFAGDRLDCWVTGAGTGGTLKGVGQVLQQEPPETQIVLCEPDNAPMLGSGIPQPREPDRSLTTSHPLFRPHLVQGWKPDFIPKLTEDALAAKLVDRVLPIDSGEAMRLSRALAQQEGIFTGISGDGAVAPVDVAAVVVGAGPAGLASAACLKKRGVEAVVLEAGPDLATSWRNHYTRLHLHTVKQHSALPGVDFPADVPRYPSREQVVAYLEQYAAHFGIAPRTGEAVRRISVADGARLAVDSTRTRYRAPVVVMATGTNRVPNPDRLPEQDRFRGQLLHAGRYRDGAPFAGQRVLVIGAGNTGAEIALDLCERGATPTLSVRTPVNVVPRDFLGIPMQVTSIRLRKLPLALADRIGRIVSRMTFGDLTRQGLLRPALGPLSSIKLRGRIPLIDVGTIAAIKRGAITVKPALARFTEDGAQFSDGSSAPFDAAILATGYRPGLGDLVDVPGALDDAGRPRHWKASDAHPGLYFVGYADVSTGLLREIGLQAEAVAAAIVGS